MDKVIPGIYADIPNDVYHRMPGISSTDLKTIHKQTPAHWKYGKDHPAAAKQEWNLGTIVHALTLEPEEVKKILVVCPADGLNTKVGKLAWLDWLTEHYDGIVPWPMLKDEMWAWIAQNIPGTVLNPGQWETAQAMAGRVLEHPQALDALEGGKPEMSVFSEYHGHLLKARPDYWTGSLVIDLKSTRDASPRGFQRQAAELGYHIQPSHYLHVCAEHGPAEAFLFIAVENTLPHEVACYLADEQMLSIGREHAYEALQQLLESRQTGDYPGYSPEVELLGLPGWMIANHDYSN